MHTHAHAPSHARTCMHAHAYMHMQRTHARACATHPCMHARMHAQTSTHTCMHIYTHAFMIPHKPSTFLNFIDPNQLDEYAM